MSSIDSDLRVEEPLFYRLTFDRLMRRSLGVMAKGLPQMLKVGLLALAPTLVILLLVPLGLSFDPMLGMAQFWILLAFQFLMGPLVTAILTYTVFMLLRGESSPDVQKSLGLAVRSLPSLLIAALLTAVVTIIGLLLCIVPGIIVSLGLLLIAPVIMVERADGILAMHRSWELTEGYRLILAGALIIPYAARWVLDKAINAMVLAGDGQLVSTISGAFASFTVEVLVVLFTACVSGVAYHDIRLSREELDEDELLAVFE